MRIGVMLAVSGVLIIAGLGLLVVGSQVVLEGIVQNSGPVGEGMELSASADLGRDVASGVFAVQVAEFQAGAFHAELAGPSGIVASVELEKSALEEKFEAETGTYTLTVSGSGDQTHVIAAVGQSPDAGKKSLGFTSVYVLVVGMALFGGTCVYGVWKRRSV
ncbi:MAG: hypothetical protein EB830_05455 [Nitrosopumilus sp. H13]|nr:MAG: hypothetical protein EB830_05455 [Nitrosopumilus sp. H13]